MFTSTIKKLQNKISSLENKINKLEKLSSKQFDDLGFSVWTKNLLNFQVLSKRKIHIITLNESLTSKYFFQLNVKFSNFSSQEIQFDLYCNDIKIGSSSQFFNSDSFEISVCGTYQNLISNNIKISLLVNPKNDKLVSILTTTLMVWGITQDASEEYSAIETNTEYVLSYISNNRLYLKRFNKELDESDSNFNYLYDAISHSICKDENNQIYLLVIDIEGNLFCKNLLNNSEIFICKNTSKVSSCYFNNMICYSCISNGDCHYGEILNNVVISNKKITSLFGKFNNCYLYSNSKKCYMILSKSDKSNYLLENITQTFSSSENLIASINLTITTNNEEE